MTFTTVVSLTFALKTS